MLRRTVRRERMLGLFAVGVVLFDPPVLNLIGGTVFGWPTLYLYLFGVWAVLIAGVALVSERGASPAEPRDRQSDDR